jgi:hypothetical protein
MLQNVRFGRCPIRWVADATRTRWGRELGGFSVRLWDQPGQGVRRATGDPLVDRAGGLAKVRGYAWGLPVAILCREARR